MPIPVGMDQEVRYKSEKLTLLTCNSFVTFTFKPSRTVDYDVNPLDCCNLILEATCQYDQEAVFDGFHKTKQLQNIEKCTNSFLLMLFLYILSIYINLNQIYS